MKAHEAACSIKVVILICDCDRDWKSGYPCWKSAFFLFSTLRFSTSPFAIPLQAKTERATVTFHQLNLEIKRNAWSRMFCERLVAFIPVCEATVFLNVDPPPYPYPPTVQIQPMKWVFWLGTGGKEPFDTDFRVSACVIRVTFLSGVAAHQAEIMRPCFMISDKSL